MADNKKVNPHAGHRDRVRDRFINEGIESFEDHVALEMLLYYAVPQKDTNELAHDLINEFGSLAGVFEASPTSLQSVKGVGKNAAVLIKLMPALYSKYQSSKIETSKLILNDPDKTGKYFANKLLCYAHEVSMAAFLDNKLAVKHAIILNEGTESHTDVSLRKVISTAINLNTPNIIIAHNHPSGVAAPSRQDVEVVRAIIKTFKKLDLVLCDSIVTSGENYYSMAAHSKFSYMFE